MDKNCVGLLISFLYLGLVLLLAILVKKRTKAKDETVRKMIHILCTNWWIIMLFLIDDFATALVGPILFMFLNSLVIIYPKLGKHFGLTNKNRNYGLVYYPFSLVILVLILNLGTLHIAAATIGVFCMGFGDGFAALFGSKWGKKKIPLPTGGKTYLGSFVMAGVCFISTFAILYFMTNSSYASILLISFLISIVAPLIEVGTPLGLDNISVPLLTALIAGGLI